MLDCHVSTEFVHNRDQHVMTQVVAAINHRLSEEYSAIDLKSQEAKDR